MSLTTRYVKKHAKTRQRRRHTAQERLARDRRQAQHAAEALQQALDALELPKDLVTEIEGRLGVPVVLEQKTTIRCNYLSLHGLAIVSVPKKARRRPVYWTSTPLTRLIDIAQPFFRVQKIAHSRICQVPQILIRKLSIAPFPPGVQ